jgi:hypothetical protein
VSITTLPIDITLSPTTVTGGNSVDCTITVDQVDQGGSSVQVDTNNRSALTPPGGGSWPYHLSFPSTTQTSQTFTINTAQLQQGTTVSIYSAEEGVDITVAANQRVSVGLPISPPGGHD